MMRKASLLFFLLLAAMPGCGPPRATVSGKLLKGGQGYAAPQGQIVTISLISQEGAAAGDAGKAGADGTPYMAEVDQSSGTFHVKGPDGRGIPVGKYRVAVMQRMSAEAYAALPKVHGGPRRDDDTLGGALTPDKSPIVREVKGSEEMVIDLDKELPKKAPSP